MGLKYRNPMLAEGEFISICYLRFLICFKIKIIFLNSPHKYNIIIFFINIIDSLIKYKRHERDSSKSITVKPVLRGNLWDKEKLAL